MAGNVRTQAQPDAAHAQAFDPEAQALQKAGHAQPPFREQLQGTGQLEANAGEHRLQDLLPEIKSLAQKLGGYRRLAEIAQTLDQSKE
jgi:hypothetical protein